VNENNDNKQKLVNEIKNGEEEDETESCCLGVTFPTLYSSSETKTIL